ncbi:MAG: type II restriction endonuclease, partial [Tidjanibacter sp.]|nr:type II restriction endonuclease [Tidjanibacter sp.]
MQTKAPFLSFLSQLAQTNTTLDFFCDFEKIKANVRAIEVKLNTLNYLIGKDDLEGAVKTLWDENPQCFSVLNILIAVRDGRKSVLSELETPVVLDTFFHTPEGVVEFLKGTGLAELFVDKTIRNLVDYVFGIEVGLDSNARKNRSGSLMEKKVATIFNKHNIPYKTEVYSSEWSLVSRALGSDKKRFDFVVETPSKKYLIEVNFYNEGGGSKLNEVARAYSDIAPKINSVEGFEFVWITDGIGWKSAKNKLQ